MCLFNFGLLSVFSASKFVQGLKLEKHDLTRTKIEKKKKRELTGTEFIFMFLCDLVFGLCDGRYSESLYALLCFGGMYHFMSGGNNLAVLFFALSGCARSNGVLNAGYLCFQTMHRAYHAMFQEKRVTVSFFTLSSCLHCHVRVSILIILPLMEVGWNLENVDCVQSHMTVIVNIRIGFLCL